MRRGPGRHRLHDAWWTLILFAVIGVAVLVTAVSFTGSLRSTVPVTLAADRSGLVMDSGAKVMMRGVQVGRVAQIGRIEWAQNGASLRLEIDPDQIRYIPANVEAQISATTAFGAKFVDLVMPQNPSRAPAGCRGQGGSRRKAGMRAIAGCHPQLPGAPAGHQHRMGNRAGHPAQPRHRASLLGQLLPGDPRGARAAVDPSVHPRAGDRAQPRGGGAAMRENLGGVVVRLGVFLAVCLLTAFLLIAVFGEVRFGDGKTYYAEFANVSNLRTGKLVRIAGVEVGKVTRISINPDATVRVQFTADNSVTLTRGTRAVIRYDNLFGDRYLALEEGAGGLAVLRPGHTIPLARTQPALDLDALIGGFKPLFRALNPEQVNALSEQLLHAFAGQGPTIGSLLAQSAAVTNTLADRDRLIGQVITNLNVVLGSLGAHTDRLDQAVTSLSALIHRLAQRKTDISNAVAYTNAAAGSVADLLSQARAPLAKVVRETDRVAGIAAADHDYLDNLLNTLPDKYQALVRQGMYGDFFAFYLCDVVLKVNGKGGQPVYIKLAGQDSGRCAPK